eukprot:scaffold81594_cov61-Attheya_sp.AAC.1
MEMGIVFCLVVLAMNEEDEARDYFYVDDQIGHDYDNVHTPSTKNDFIELLDAFLAFHTWYKKEKFWSLGNEAYAKGMATTASRSPQ